jgi:predicted DNA-binding mobile mystery protein A
MTTPVQQRRILDGRLSAWRAFPMEIPHKGWIHAVRRALLMPRNELARRLGVSDQAVAQLERSELDGRIRLDSLRRVAEAMDCRLVYAFVPTDSLDAIVDRRAQIVVERDLGRARHTMTVEDQTVDDASDALLFEEMVAKAKTSSLLWRD